MALCSFNAIPNPYTSPIPILYYVIEFFYGLKSSLESFNIKINNVYLKRGAENDFRSIALFY